MVLSLDFHEHLGFDRSWAVKASGLRQSIGWQSVFEAPNGRQSGASR